MWPPKVKLARFKAPRTVRVIDGVVTEHFQMLCNPGRWIPEFIVNLTGITNEMVADKPTCGEATAGVYLKLRELHLEKLRQG